MKFLGIDLGGTKIRGAVIEQDGTILDEKTDLTHAEEGKDKVIQRILDFIKSFVDANEISAIGIGTPGPIDYEIGSVISSPNLPFENVQLKKIIEERFDLPVALDRDANCALIGEHWMGEAKGIKNVVMVTLGTGVGGAIIIDNKIYRGHSDLAGEIGHMIIDEEGPECGLGHKGCLESFIGGRALELRCGKPLKEIFSSARNGNIEDTKIIDQVADHLVTGLRNVVTLFDPELILLDGGAAENTDLFVDKLKDFPVKVSKLAKVAGVIGAARIAMDVNNK